MAEVLEPIVTQETLAKWYKLREKLSKLKQEEALLRSLIYKHYFKDPKEGTNNHPLDDGTGAVLKATRVVDRKVDQGQLEALKKAQHDALEATKAGAPMPNIPVLNYDKLVVWKPEVAIREYRALTEHERHFFEQCLIIKDGSPQMEIVIPKRAVAG